MSTTGEKTFEESDNNEEVSNTSTTTIEEMLEQYDNNKKGYLLYIANTSHFEETLNLDPMPLIPASFERRQITQVARERNFELRIEENLTLQEIRRLIYLFRCNQNIFKECSSFFIVVSTHGKNSDLLYARDGVYSIDELFHFFDNPSWDDKPKALLIGASRGNFSVLETPESMFKDYLQYPESCNIFQYEEGDEMNILRYTDIIVILAASAGTIAFDDLTKPMHDTSLNTSGNLYLRTFFETLRAKDEKIDILDLLTEVQKEVTDIRRRYEVMGSFAEEKGIDNMMKLVHKDAIQVPCYYSSLRKPYLI